MPTKYTATPTEAALTLEELERMKHGRDDWRPQRALAYCWARFDPIHGHGGSHYGGRPFRPGDPGHGDAWSWAGFSAKLEQDRKRSRTRSRSTQSKRHGSGVGSRHSRRSDGAEIEIRTPAPFWARPTRRCDCLDTSTPGRQRSNEWNTQL